MRYALDVFVTYDQYPCLAHIVTTIGTPTSIELCHPPTDRAALPELIASPLYIEGVLATCLTLCLRYVRDTEAECNELLSNLPGPYLCTDTYITTVD